MGHRFMIDFFRSSLHYGPFRAHVLNRILFSLASRVLNWSSEVPCFINWLSCRRVHYVNNLPRPRLKQQLPVPHPDREELTTVAPPLTRGIDQKPTIKENNAKNASSYYESKCVFPGGLRAFSWRSVRERAKYRERAKRGVRSVLRGALDTGRVT